VPASDIESMELSDECLTSMDRILIATNISSYNIDEGTRLISGFIQYLLSKDKHPKNPTNPKNSKNSND